MALTLTALVDGGEPLLKDLLARGLSPAALADLAAAIKLLLDAWKAVAGHPAAVPVAGGGSGGPGPETGTDGPLSMAEGLAKGLSGRWVSEEEISGLAESMGAAIAADRLIQGIVIGAQAVILAGGGAA